MAITDEGLKENLMQDVSQAQERAGKSQLALGVPGQEIPSAYAPKALRISGRAMGQKQLHGVNESFNRAIANLSEEAGMTDMAQKAEFGRTMQKKLNQLRMSAMLAAGQAAKADLGKQISQKKRQETMAAIAAIAESTGSAIIGGIGKGSPPMPGMGGPGLQMPEFGAGAASGVKPSLMPGPTPVGPSLGNYDFLLRTE